MFIVMKQVELCIRCRKSKEFIEGFLSEELNCLNFYFLKAFIEATTYLLSRTLVRQFAPFLQLLLTLVWLLSKYW